MKKVQRSSFKLNPIAAAIAIAMSSQFAVNVAHAASGFGNGVDINNAPVKVPTYYANSPVGPVPALVNGAQSINAVTGLPVVIPTGKALRKFVDTLPGIPGVTKFGANNLGQYIPLAVPEKWVDLNGTTTTDDYYEIAAVEFSEKMHSDLVKATHLRGYVQLSTIKNPGKHIALKYLDGSPILDAAGVQVYAYDKPHHLGPVINSTKGTAVRVKFSNYLPVGVGGELFIPVDTTITGAGLGPDGVTPYTQNRAEIHLVGGQSPWISAGSPHQWVAPAGEVGAYAAGLGKGASAQNVPDMDNPGNGSTTLYFPNDMSARFMFYQDRTSGLTRLNSYAGLEAGYFVKDSTEQGLIDSGTIPAEQIPLIIEDKTFVPSNIAQQDAKWDTAHWGQPGDLWFPHVYEPNQDPSSIDGANPVGRWDYGPLFWPIFPAKNALPSGNYGDASFTPEAYMDTPVINGTAYPTLTVDPKAYRLRILNASNDRYINLGFYKADASVVAPQLDVNGNPIVDRAGVQQFFSNTEVKMVAAVGDAAGNPVGWDANLGVQLPQPQYPKLKTNINAEPSGPSRAWPVDGRAGGAPDPMTAGPDFIVIGNEGGFLPNPVDIPAHPITYEANRRSITVGNIYGYGMLLGPAERADTIVDFSQYAGQTLILYNDAPAPTPFNDVRNDYYTGGPDYTGSGGAYSTKPGYGPNTRTMMQIKVSNAAPAAAFNADALVIALPAAYGASQPMPIVPAIAYNAAFNTNDTDIYAHVATGSAAQPTLDFSTSVNGAVTLTGLTLVTSGGTAGAGGVVVKNDIPGSGTGYDPIHPPTVVFNNVVNGVNCLSANGISASATAVVDQGTPAKPNTPAIPSTRQVTKITDFVAGSGYTCAPTITFSNPPGTNGIGAQVTVSSTHMSQIAVLTKAEQELFDASGRYNTTGGIELPLTNGVIQTTVPLNYFDSATEFIKDGEVQIWKLVDNGFWSNSMHFDMVDVQLINRVGWDGTVKAPATNEVGWRDTLRLNPLEDVIIAMRAKRPTIPFGLPQSNRLLDPSKPLNTTGASASGLGFTTAAGVPNLQSSNVKDNFDNEFTWGSAILGHAENDFTRPVVFQPTVTKPNAPSNLNDPAGTGMLTWTDPTPVAAATTMANAQNEIGFKILQANVDNVGNLGAFTPVLSAAGVPVTVPANVTSWTLPLPIDPALGYAVVAYNAAGDSAPSAGFMEQMPIAPTTFKAEPVVFNSVTLTWSGASTSNKLEVWRNGVLIATLPGTATGYVDNAANAALNKYTPAVSALAKYVYQIKAVNALAPVPTGVAVSALLEVITPMEFVAAPTIQSATTNVAGTQVTLTWTDNANNETAYLVEWATDGVTFNNQLPLIPRNPNQKKATLKAVSSTIPTTPGSVYTFRVTAVNVTGAATSTSAPVLSLPVDLTAGVAPTAPATLTATTTKLTWPAATGISANATVSYVVQQSVNGGPYVAIAGSPFTARNANVTSATGNDYTYQVQALATRYGLAAVTSGVTTSNKVSMAPAASTTPVATAGVAGSKKITVTWTNTSNNITGFTVQRRLGNNGGWTTILPAITPAATSYSFTDTAPAAGSYSYRVTATSLGGNTTATSNAVVAP